MLVPKRWEQLELPEPERLVEKIRFVVVRVFAHLYRFYLDKAKLKELPAWEGDFIFLELMERHAPYFELELHYNGERLDRAILNGTPLPLPNWRDAIDALY